MKKRNKIIILGLTAVSLLAIVLLAVVNGADPVAKLVRQGNGAYAEQAYLEALELYQNAQIENPELAEPYYNAANAFYQEGQYEQALAQMQQALLYADEELAQHSYFNLGNSFYNAQDLGTAVQSYIQALLLNPNDADAKYNLELALNQQQQEQNQEQQEQDQQEQDQNGEGQQDQQDQSGENGDQQNDQQEGQEGEQNENQNGEQQNEGQDGRPQDQQNQDGQPNQPGQPGDQPGTQAGLQPGEKLSEEQAEQLLAAIAGNAQTLQEKLGQILVVPGPPPAQDW